MFYILLFIVVIVLVIYILHKSSGEYGKKYAGDWFMIVLMSSMISFILTFIIGVIVYAVVNIMSDHKTVLINSKPIIEQKYKQREEYYSIYKSENEEIEKYYYTTVKNGIYVLDSKPVDQTELVYSKNTRVETYIDKYANPNVKFWFWGENKRGEKYIIYINDRNFNLK